MQHMKITAELKTPVAFSGFFTLDALLGGILFQTIQDVDATHAAIPVKCVDGLFHASAVQTEDPETREVCTTAGLHARHDPRVSDMIKRNPKTGAPAKQMSVKKRVEGGNVMTYFTLHETPSVSWDVVGDAERIISLLTDVSFIGAHRARGWGEIDDWIFDDSDRDGLIDVHGNPSRPIPRRMMPEHNGPIVDAAWRPAYWNPVNREACVIPC